MTSISSALDFSGGLFDASGVRGIRRVVDVSGDGPNNSGRPVLPARDDLIAKGVIINGLPIMLKLATGYFDIPDLDRYYTDCVIGGPGAFMIPIKDRREFLTATRRKLLLEISGPRAACPPHPRAGPADARSQRLQHRRAAVAPLPRRRRPELSLLRCRLVVASTLACATWGERRGNAKPPQNAASQKWRGGLVNAAVKA